MDTDSPARRRLRDLAHRGEHAPFDRRRSEAYDRRARGVLGALYVRVAAEVAAAAPRRAVVVDIGTGPGRLLHQLARARDDLALHGVDVSTDMIAVARRNAVLAGLADRIELRPADVAALPFPDAGVDVVVATLSQHHWPDLDAAAAELARVLRPGGLLLVYDFRFVPVGPALDAYERSASFTAADRSSLRLPWHPVALLTRLSLRRR